jgi:glycosyltransferase involved in cell wall biosynthesis
MKRCHSPSIKLNRYKQKPLVSVCICTYNRANLLAEALASLVCQSSDSSLYEIIVIDNNSTDQTVEVTSAFSKQYPFVRRACETQQGLSHARNRGFNEAKAGWVAYMDDDAKAYPDFIEQALRVMDMNSFDCFGGVYLPWYRYGKPKWFQDHYATNGRLREDIGILKTENASGGVIVFRKKVLEQLGGFPVDLGMHGQTIGYGEETYVQMQMRKEGFTIGFNPELKIEHIVALYKLDPFWIIKSEFYHGYHSWKSTERKASWYKLANILVDALYRLVLRLVIQLTNLRHNDYYIQNWLIDAFAPFANSMGRVAGGVGQIID